MSVSFYSSKRQAGVNIPKNEVCGYRIKNPIMKNGYSDGLRVGKNNTVVNQSLSRFSSEREREEQKAVCGGNTNWLNHVSRDRGFKNTKKMEDIKNQFILRRPAFLAGSIDNQPESGQVDRVDLENERRGIGNRVMKRPNFLASPIAPRQVKEFRDMEVVAVSEAKEFVSSLGKELGFTTTIEMPDPTDFTWLREKERMEAELNKTFSDAGIPERERKALIDRELEINKPLGRDQRTITKKTDKISKVRGLDIRQKLIEIQEEVKSGRAENKKVQIVIAKELRLIIDQIRNIEDIKNTEFNIIASIVSRLNISPDWRDLGLPRIIDVNTFNDNRGDITLFLLSNFPSGLNANDPLLVWIPSRMEYLPRSLRAVFQLGANKFLDLGTRRIETREHLEELGLI